MQHPNCRTKRPHSVNQIHQSCIPACTPHWSPLSIQQWVIENAALAVMLVSKMKVSIHVAFQQVAIVEPAVLNSRVATASLNTQSAKNETRAEVHVTTQSNWGWQSSYPQWYYYSMFHAMTTMTHRSFGEEDCFLVYSILPRTLKPQCIVRACGKYVVHNETTTLSPPTFQTPRLSGFWALQFFVTCNVVKERYGP